MNTIQDTQKQLDKWFNKYGGAAIQVDKNIRATAQAELEAIFHAYLEELIRTEALPPNPKTDGFDIGWNAALRKILSKITGERK